MRESKRVPAVLNSYEQLALLRQPNPRAPTGLRNLCIISLMLKLGLRVSEIINLKTDDMEWEEGKVRVKGSGAARERTLWVDESEMALLRQWLRTRPAESRFLFTTLTGSRLKDRYIREMVKRLARRAGIDKDVYPHLLRYTFAVDFMRETRDINLLQDALGHRDPAATQAYTKLLFSEHREFKFSDNISLRSGMPVNAGQQQRLSVSENSAAYRYESSNPGGFNAVETKKEEPRHREISAAKSEAAKNSIVSTADPESSGDADPGISGSGAAAELSDINSREDKVTGDDENKAVLSDFKEDGNTNIPEDSASIPEANINIPGAEREAPEESVINEPFTEPGIALVADERQGKKIKIPAMKCSSCGYILRYKGNCPQCGTSLSAILNHWRKNI